MAIFDGLVRNFSTVTHDFRIGDSVTCTFMSGNTFMYVSHAYIRAINDDYLVLSYAAFANTPCTNTKWLYRLNNIYYKDILYIEVIK